MTANVEASDFGPLRAKVAETFRPQQANEVVVPSGMSREQREMLARYWDKVVKPHFREADGDDLGQQLGMTALKRYQETLRVAEQSKEAMEKAERQRGVMEDEEYLKLRHEKQENQLRDMRLMNNALADIAVAVDPTHNTYKVVTYQ